METHGVTVRELCALRGPNLWSYKPALHAVIDIGPYEHLSSTSFPGFTERLIAWLPGLREHECGVGRPGGFAERLAGGTLWCRRCWPGPGLPAAEGEAWSCS